MPDDSAPPLAPVPPTKSMVGFNLQSTLGSPFFWLAVGAAAVLLYQHQQGKKEKARAMRNVTPQGFE